MSSVDQSSTPNPPLSQTDDDPSFEWDAFISYRRRDGYKLAKWLRYRLQKYRLPVDILSALNSDTRSKLDRPLKIWLDKAYEKSSDDFLSKKIFPSLDRSQRLIVLLTPSAMEMIQGGNGNSEPNWLMREIDRFMDSKDRPDRPIDVIVGPKGPIDSFPGRLSEKDHWDWIDFRKFKNSISMWLHDELDQSFVKLVASIYNIPDNLLPILHREEQRRRVKFLVGITAAVLAVAITTGGLGFYAMLQQKKAIVNSKISDALRMNSKAELIISQQPSNIASGVMLSAVAMKRLIDLKKESPEASDVVRRGLALLPFIEERHTISAPGFGRSYHRSVFTKDGQMLAVCDNEHPQIQLFSIRNGITPRTIAVDSIENEIQFSDDSRFMVTISSDRSEEKHLTVWDLSDIPNKIFEKRTKIEALAISRDGSLIFLAEKDGKGGHLFETASGKEIFSTNSTTSVMEALFSPDGKYLATIKRFRDPDLKKNLFTYSLELRSIHDQRIVFKISPNKEFGALTFSPDSKLVAIVEDQLAVKLIETSTGNTRLTIASPDRNGIEYVWFSPSGAMITYGGYNPYARIIRVNDGVEVFRAQAHGGLYEARFSSDERLFAPIFVGDPVIHVWDLENKAEVARLPHGNDILSAAFISNSHSLATSSSDGYLRVWGMPTITARSRLLVERLEDTEATAISNEGRFIATVSEGRGYDAPSTIQVWDSKTNKNVFAVAMEKTLHGQISYSATNSNGNFVSCNGGLVAAVGYWGSGQLAQVWNIKSGNEVFRIPDTPALRSIYLSNNGKSLLALKRSKEYEYPRTGGTHGAAAALQMWDLVNKQLLFTISTKAKAASFRGDDHQFAVISNEPNDSTRISIYDAQNGNRLASFTAPGTAEKIGLYKDFLTLQINNTIEVWNIRSKEKIQSFKSNGTITNFAVDSSMTFLAACNDKGTAQIWRMRDGQDVLKIQHGDYLSSIAFSNEDNLLVTVNGYKVYPQGKYSALTSSTAFYWHWTREDILHEARERLSGYLSKERLLGIEDEKVSVDSLGNESDGRPSP